MPVVEVKKVWKSYDRVNWVLRDIDLAVEAGEVVVLTGRSGSGKSTLLNLMLGLETPTRGAVLVEDQDLSSMDDEARTQLRLNRLGIVFQQYHLIPELTVGENVHLPMKLAKKPDPVRVKRLLQHFGIEHRADAFPSTLSGGESQRAAIARALANRPVVVLADEPTANLDDENAKRALLALRGAADAFHTGVIIASHDSLATTVGDRVIRLDNGALFPIPAGPGSRPTPSPVAAPRPTPGQKSPTPGTP